VPGSAGLDELDASHVFAAAAAGDPYCRGLVESVAKELTAGIVSLVHVFNPRMVVLAAASWRTGDARGYRLGGVAEGTFRGFLPGLKIALSTFGDDAGLVGAAALVVQQTATESYDSYFGVAAAIAAWVF